MAVKKWFFKDATASGSSHGSLTETPPTASSTSGTGWRVDAVASGYSLMTYGSQRISSTFAAPVQPASAPTTNDCLRTIDGTGTGKYTGTFASGTWTVGASLSSVGGSGANVKLSLRVWRSVNADGSSATEITSGAVETAADTGIDSGNHNLTVTFNPGAVTVSGEYIFLQPALHINGAAVSTADANLSLWPLVGAATGVWSVTTPNFTDGAATTTPTFQAAGTAVSGTGAVTPTWPAHAVGDVALLFVESANEANALTTASGFVEVTNSPQGTGTAASTTATKLSVFWCRATTASQAAPVVGDPGDHVIAQIITFRGCVASGNPWDITAGDTAAASATVTVPGATTTQASTLVVLAAANPVDSAADQSFKNWVNSSLANITEIASSNTTQGNGGGFTVATGEKQAAGAYGSSTCTRLTSTVQGRMSIALMPPASGSAGSSTGTSTVTAVGASSTAASVGASSGVGTATATGKATAAAVGSSTGAAVAAATGASTAQGAGASTGTSAASAVATSMAVAVGSSAGSATATARGAADAVASAVAAGGSTVGAAGGSMAQASGAATGSSTAVALSATESAGQAAGTSTAAAGGASTADASGVAAGTSMAAATSQSSSVVVPPMGLYWPPRRQRAEKETERLLRQWLEQQKKHPATAPSTPRQVFAVAEFVPGILETEAPGVAHATTRRGAAVDFQALLPPRENSGIAVGARNRYASTVNDPDLETLAPVESWP